MNSRAATQRTLQDLSQQVRGFISEQLRAGRFEPVADSWLSGFSPEFSRELGYRGWLGMTWPTAYGGGGRSAIERFCVLEELLAAGAPVAAHWAGDRQVGPSLLRNGTESQKAKYLPGIARGEIFFCLGLSEPDSGSDLASIRTSARRREDGTWLLSGTKLWTSGAHHKHYMLTLCRSDSSEDRHRGLTQFIVDLSLPGVRIRPIYLLSGEHHFNEVSLTEVVVCDEDVLGEVGGAWAQITAELAEERAGPERYMSTMPTFLEFGYRFGARPEVRADLGRLAGQFWSIRALSRRIASGVDSGEVSALDAALAKDLGTRLEQDSIEVIRRSFADDVSQLSTMARLMRGSISHSPGFTLRGGTTEILRSVVARKLGM